MVLLFSCNHTENKNVVINDGCSFVLPSDLYLEVNSLGHYTIVDFTGRIIDRELTEDNVDLKWGFKDQHFKYAFKDSCEAKEAAISYLNQDEYKTFKRLK
jgi:hypothetical protein